MNTVEQLFLGQLKAKKQLAQIYLQAGIKLIGYVLDADEFTILITTRSGGEQMLYKHSITTISTYREEQ